MYNIFLVVLCRIKKKKSRLEAGPDNLNDYNIKLCKFNINCI